ncbi:MAG: hypothetical protein AAFO69_07320 [Bacteroidota bacterium]
MKRTTLIITIILSAFIAKAQWTNSGTQLTSPGSTVTKTQLTEHAWSGSHGILFNAYKNITTNGPLYALGNTRYANNVGANYGGAGSIMFMGNGGTMDFYITNSSTGKDTDINWGIPKMRLTRYGLVGIGTGTPKAKLDINHTGTLGNRFIESNAFLKISSGGSSLLMDNNEIYSNHMLLIGSAFNHDIRFRNISSTNYADLMTIRPSGNVGIGTTTPSHKLSVNGTIRAKEIKCQASPWPDYVFTDTYELKSLSSVADFISENGHLPNIPSAAEVEENGIALGEMNARLLEKIEELTLYAIDQEQQNMEQQEVISKLLKRMTQLEDQISSTKK